MFILRKIVVFIIVIFFLAGCGTAREVEPVVSSGQKEGNMETGQGEVISHIQEVSPLLFQYHVINETGKDITLDFTSSQRFDYSIKNSNGEVVFLFSSVTSFLQVVGKEVLSGGDQLSYDINVKDVELSRGKYTLTAWMTPKTGKAYSASVTFSVE